MASKDTLALYLPDASAGGPPDAFMDGHEFCHLHPQPETAVHAMLPKQVRAQAMSAGWAEPHPITHLGILPESLVMLYAPRCKKELDIVFRFIQKSYEYARGLRKG